MHTPFTKSITAQFETIGRRQRLVGFIAELRDESGLLLFSQSFDTKPQAEAALDSLVHELLIDYAQRGLVDTVPVADVNWNSSPVACDPPDGPPAIGDGPGEDNPPPDNRFPICRACHTGIYPASSMQPAFCIECVNAMLHGLDNRFSAAQFAQTRQSIAIEAKLAVCRNCGGIHHIQRCPELTRALCTPEPPPWHDAELGKELCWMVWHRYQAFITLLHSVPSNQLIIYAASYQAFMRSHSPASDLTITQILEKWNRWMRGDRGAVIRQVAA
mgnify:FL=1